MSQLDKILKHMDRNGSITQREALLDYSIQSLTARIAELRSLGYPIVTVTKSHPTTGQRYARYFPNKLSAREYKKESHSVTKKAA